MCIFWTFSFIIFKICCIFVADIIIQAENENKRTTKKRKLSSEADLRILRIRNVIEKEQQRAEIQLQHEKTIASIKETHLKKLNKLELRTSLAKAELAELLLEKEKHNFHTAI